MHAHPRQDISRTGESKRQERNNLPWEHGTGVKSGNILNDQWPKQVDETEYLNQIWEKMMQQYRSLSEYHASDCDKSLPKSWFNRPGDVRTASGNCPRYIKNESSLNQLKMIRIRSSLTESGGYRSLKPSIEMSNDLSTHQKAFTSDRIWNSLRVVSDARVLNAISYFTNGMSLERRIIGSQSTK
jgi:hypothetical protein